MLKFIKGQAIDDTSADPIAIGECGPMTIKTLEDGLAKMKEWEKEEPVDKPKYSVITCAYNSLLVVKRAYESILPAIKESAAELIIVDNHSTDERTREYIRQLAAENVNVYVADPGKNIGCHGGWNFGYAVARGDFVLKYDDDTVMTTAGWLEKLASALEDVPELGYVSADIDAKQNNVYEDRQIKGHILQVPKTGVVGFSCVMFRRSDIQRWGPMKTGPYHCAGTTEGRRVITKDRLYGGEEVYYAGIVLSEGHFYAHYPAVFVHHLGNEERNPDYVFWKRAYGYYGWTDKPLHEWISSGEFMQHYWRAIHQEYLADEPNDCLLVEWCRRLGEIGQDDVVTVTLLADVRAVTMNGHVRETCAKAIAQIKERYKNG